eukprot:1302000-Pleurochrysis_carterae.AAC.2
MDIIALIGGISAATVSIVGSITAYLIRSRWTHCSCCGIWECERNPTPLRPSEAKGVEKKMNRAKQVFIRETLLGALCSAHSGELDLLPNETALRLSVLDFTMPRRFPDI